MSREFGCTIELPWDINLKEVLPEQFSDLAEIEWQYPDFGVIRGEILDVRFSPKFTRLYPYPEIEKYVCIMDLCVRPIEHSIRSIEVDF